MLLNIKSVSHYTMCTKYFKCGVAQDDNIKSEQKSSKKGPCVTVLPVSINHKGTSTTLTVSRRPPLNTFSFSPNMGTCKKKTYGMSSALCIKG